MAWAAVHLASDELRWITKKHVVIRDATHFVLFEKPRLQFFDEILKFLKD